MRGTPYGKIPVNTPEVESVLCQNCVTYPVKPPPNSVIYGHTCMHIVVAGRRWSEVRWWDLVCVSTRGGNQFPSVLLLRRWRGSGQLGG